MLLLITFLLCLLLLRRNGLPCGRKESDILLFAETRMGLRALGNLARLLGNWPSLWHNISRLTFLPLICLRWCPWCQTWRKMNPVMKTRWGFNIYWFISLNFPIKINFISFRTPRGSSLLSYLTILILLPKLEKSVKHLRVHLQLSLVFWSPKHVLSRNPFGTYQSMQNVIKMVAGLPRRQSSVFKSSLRIQQSVIKTSQRKQLSETETPAAPDKSSR